MKIPTTYSPKISIEKYQLALMKVPFSKFHFALKSIASYPDHIKKDLTPHLSKRLYPIWRQPLYAPYIKAFTPYLFDSTVNPSAKKWWESLKGADEEGPCWVSLIHSGLMSQHLDLIPSIRSALSHFLQQVSGYYSEQLGEPFRNGNHEDLLRFCLQQSPPQLQAVFLRNASLRPTPLSSSFWENCTVSDLKCKDLLKTFGLISSFWGAGDLFASQLSAQDIRYSKLSFLSTSIYQVPHQELVSNPSHQKKLTDFFEKVLSGKVNCIELLTHPLQSPFAFNPFFYHALIEASQSSDLDQIIPLWQKSDHSVFLECLEHPKVLAHMIKKELPQATKTSFSKKM